MGWGKRGEREGTGSANCQMKLPLVLAQGCIAGFIKATGLPTFRRMRFQPVEL